jgi:hypothetical protein
LGQQSRNENELERLALSPLRNIEIENPNHFPTPVPSQQLKTP